MGMIRFFNKAMSAMTGMSVSVGSGGGASTPDFEWTYSGSGTTKTYYFTVANGEAYTIDWGDTTTSEKTGSGAEQGTAHTYGNGTFTGKITMANTNALTTVYLSLTGISGSLPDPAKYAELTSYKVGSNSGITADVPSFANNTKLTTIVFNACDVTDTFPSISHITTLLTVYVQGGNQLSGAVPDLAALTSLTTFDADTNSFSSYAGTAFPASLILLDLWGNAISSADEIDRILGLLDTAGASNGTVDLRAGTNAIPSAAGLTSKTNLEGKGWTVNVAS